MDRSRQATVRGALGSAIVTLALFGVIGCEVDGPPVQANEAQTVTEDRMVELSRTVLKSNDGTYFVIWNSDPVPIPLNEEFTMEVDILPRGEAVSDSPDLTLTVDARMPEHRHGMIQRPLITREEDGGFLVEGMLFHMPGYWQIHFDVTRGGVTERAQDEVTLD